MADTYMEYVCGECGSTHENETDANECCEEEKKESGIEPESDVAFFCGECDSEHDSEEDAEECCKVA